MKHVLLSLFLFLGQLLVAQSVPSLTTYQGRLTDANGNSVPDGTGYEIEVRLWPASTGGAAPLWAARYAGVAVKNGAFNVILGSSAGTTISGASTVDLQSAFVQANVFLGITITKNAAGLAITSPTEILPRQQLLTVPFALKSELAARATLADNATLAQTVAPNSITQASIADGGISTADFADLSVTELKIAPAAVGSNQIRDGSVVGAKIPDNSIALAKLELNAATFIEEQPAGQPSADPSYGVGRRTLNKTVFASGDSIARNGSLITLKPGVYNVFASAPISGGSGRSSSLSGSHQLLIREVSTSGVLLRGTSDFFYAGGNMLHASCYGIVSLSVEKTVEVFHYASANAASAGLPAFTAGEIANAEVYTTITIVRLK